MLNKQEINFIFNTLMPVSLSKIKEGEYKSKLQLFFNANNPDNFISLDTKLEKENLTKSNITKKLLKIR